MLFKEVHWGVLSDIDMVAGQESWEKEDSRINVEIALVFWKSVIAN